MKLILSEYKLQESLPSHENLIQKAGIMLLTRHATSEYKITNALQFSSL